MIKNGSVTQRTQFKKVSELVTRTSAFINHLKHSKTPVPLRVPLSLSFFLSFSLSHTRTHTHSLSLILMFLSLSLCSKTCFFLLFYLAFVLLFFCDFFFFFFPSYSIFQVSCIQLISQIHLYAASKRHRDSPTITLSISLQCLIIILQ